MSPGRARGRLPRGRAPGVITGRTVASTVMVLAGFTLAALVTFAAVFNRVTRLEVIAGLIVLVIAAVAALWLRRDRRTS